MVRGSFDLRVQMCRRGYRTIQWYLFDVCSLMTVARHVTHSVALCSHSNLKYLLITIVVLADLLIDLHFPPLGSSPVLPGGGFLRVAGGALQHFYVGSPRWAMVG